MRCLKITGSHTELQYDLMTSGIPIDAIPVTANGRLKTNNHTQWIARRRAKEASEEFLYGQGTFNKIDIPSHRDILVGKGKPFQQHPGNVYLRFLVGQKMYEYANACKRVKPYITWELVERIQATSGCFPGKGDDDWWVEATDQEARRKVRFLFLALRKGRLFYSRVDSSNVPVDRLQRHSLQLWWWRSSEILSMISKIAANVGKSSKKARHDPDVLMNDQSSEVFFLATVLQVIVGAALTVRRK